MECLPSLVVFLLFHLLAFFNFNTVFSETWFYSSFSKTVQCNRYPPGCLDEEALIFPEAIQMGNTPLRWHWGPLHNLSLELTSSVLWRVLFSISLLCSLGCSFSLLLLVVVLGHFPCNRDGSTLMPPSPSQEAQALNQMQNGNTFFHGPAIGQWSYRSQWNRAGEPGTWAAREGNSLSRTHTTSPAAESRSSPLLDLSSCKTVLFTSNCLAFYHPSLLCLSVCRGSWPSWADTEE